MSISVNQSDQNCARCGCKHCCCQGPRGPRGFPGPTGATGSTGPTGAAGIGSDGTIIPFSISKYGSPLYTDNVGEPLLVSFSGFGGASSYEFLQEGEFASGTITIREGMNYGTSFIMPSDGVLQNIYVLISNMGFVLFEAGSIIRPFVCIAVSNSNDLVYTILQSTMTFTDPYIGGIEYPALTTRRGSLTNLNIPIAEGTLVAIVAGIRGENVTEQQVGNFAASGGLLFELE